MYKEHCPLYERVLTDNSLHNKVLVTFTAVYMEIVNLKDEFLHKYVHRILNYGEISKLVPQIHVMIAKLQIHYIIIY